MPKLLAKVEGKGNGIKTVIVNMPEIAKSLNRPPMYPTKYFGCLLGAQVNFDNKSERYIVNGAHDPNKLQDLLDGFIQEYVLCQSCGGHETMMSVDKKKSTISLECRACSHSGTVIKVNDSFSAYILKNPPPKTSGTLTNSSAAGNVASRLGPIAKQARVSEDCNQDDEVDDLDSDDLEELDYGDDDDDYDQAQSQVSMEQGSSSQPTHNNSTSHRDEDDEEPDEDDDDDDVNHDVDPDESLDADTNQKEDDRMESDAEKDGDKVRCRYWPSCVAQESCQFYHPTKPCRDFLRCTYGDRCLYIHPPCKFSPNCTKPKCPFSHPAVLTTGVKRKAPAMQFRNLQQPAAPKCKFGFKCTNLMCKFSHQPSEDCRYGTNCLLENCPYTHPTDSMPRKKPTSVFKWSAQS